MKAMLGRLRGRWRLSRIGRRDPALAETIAKVREQGLTYLDVCALCDLAEAVLDIEQRGVQGSIIEAGCAHGGSAIVLARAKSPARRMQVFDAFGMIPAPTEPDGEAAKERYRIIASGKSPGVGGGEYYGYVPDLIGRVRDAFGSFGLEPEQNCIELIPGLYAESLDVEGPVAMAHLDCDWYESVRVCLERIVPNLQRGGRIVFDDYDFWPGCRRAADEYFAERDAQEFSFIKRSRMHVRRN